MTFPTLDRRESKILTYKMDLFVYCSFSTFVLPQDLAKVNFYLLIYVILLIST